MIQASIENTCIAAHKETEISSNERSAGGMVVTNEVMWNVIVFKIKSSLDRWEAGDLGRNALKEQSLPTNTEWSLK